MLRVYCRCPRFLEIGGEIACIAEVKKLYRTVPMLSSVSLLCEQCALGGDNIRMPYSKKGLKITPCTKDTAFHSMRKIYGDDWLGVRFSRYRSKMESVGCPETSLKN